jgi:hypothetical protein
VTKEKDSDRGKPRDDGWKRERLVDAAAKSGRKREAPAADKKQRPASKGRVHKGRTRA